VSVVKRFRMRLGVGRCPGRVRESHVFQWLHFPLLVKLRVEGARLRAKVPAASEGRSRPLVLALGPPVRLSRLSLRTA